MTSQADRAHGFSLADHKRVSTVVRNAEGGLYEPTRATTKPEGRGLVRVMWLADVPAFGTATAQAQQSGDWTCDAAPFPAILTRPIPNDARVDYYVRCAISGPPLVGPPRTWQLRVCSPDDGGDNFDPSLTGTVTAKISEMATGQQVQDAINATGCPACTVVGSPATATDEDGNQQPWPARVWHIYWPNKPGWYLTTTRPPDPLPTPPTPYVVDYSPGNGEVTIQLVQTAYEPTPFCETITLPYQRTQTPPLPGAFAMCLPMADQGLVVIDQECWNYAD